MVESKRILKKGNRGCGRRSKEKKNKEPKWDICLIKWRSEIDLQGMDVENF